MAQERFAAEHGVSVEGLHESTTLTAELQTHIEDVVNPLLHAWSIRKFTVLPSPSPLSAVI